jgi:hypothetical protein
LDPDPAEIRRGISLGALTSHQAELILTTTGLRGYWFRAASMRRLIEWEEFSEHFTDKASIDRMFDGCALADFT